LAVRLFVGNLAYSTTEADLRTYFGAVAPPSQVVLPVDRETGRPRGFAFVEFLDRAHAEQAIQRFNGQPYNGRRSRSAKRARARIVVPVVRRARRLFVGAEAGRRRICAAPRRVRRAAAALRWRRQFAPAAPQDAAATSGRTPSRSAAAARRARRRATTNRAARFR
jgi:RNA recognition motif-containing protein